MMAYASYNRGFKSGVYNLASPNLAPFHPEKLDDFEIGVKSELFDRALIFNINGFYYKYANIQVQNFPAGGLGARSEEHTSELQSLMRISYAVFCLKKKKIINTIHTQQRQHIYD